MEKLFVHMGVAKTGSSSLQVFLARNRPALARAGIDYLGLGEIQAAAEGRITSGNAGPLSRVFFQPGHSARAEDPDGLFPAQFRHVVGLSKLPIGLLSSELLSGLRQDGMEAFRDMILAEKLQPTVLVYIRRQDHRMAANYAQRVKRHACTLYPEEYVDLNLPRSRGLDYLEFVDKLDRVFGADNVIVRVYEETQNLAGRVIEDFMRTLTGDFVPEMLNLDVPDINPTPSPKELKFMLYANKFRPHMYYSDDVMRYGAILGRDGANSARSILSPKLRKRIIDHFAATNSLLAQRRFGRDQLFDTKVDNGYQDLRKVKLAPADWMDFLSLMSTVQHQRMIDLEREVKFLKTRFGRLEKEKGSATNE